MKYNYFKVVNMLSVILIILLSSCSSEESVVPVFSVDIAADSFVPEGGSKTITLTSNIAWSASSSADWLTVSPSKGTGGTTVTLTAAENNMPATRKGVVTLTPETGEAIKISVSQATRYQFYVDEIELTFSPISDTLNVSLTSKTSWEVASSEDWLTVSPKNGQGSSILTFTASPNNTLIERHAVITLTPDIGDAIEISVIQNDVKFYTDVMEVSFSANPEEKFISLLSNVSWEATSNVDWLTIDPIVGTGTNTDLEKEQINLTVPRNGAEEERSAIITLIPEIGEPITISVMQKGSNYISQLVGARRFINNFDHDESYYQLTSIPLPSSTQTIIHTEFDSKVKRQGNMSLKCDFEFSGKEGGIVRLQKTFYEYITDLDFYPLGVSLWINSSGLPDRFMLNLLQQNEDFTLPKDRMYTFTYINDTVLSEKGWQELVIPYESFVNLKDKNHKLNFSRVHGYQFDIENVSQSPHKGVVYFDAFEQLTSYKPIHEGTPMFTSIFIQPHPPQHSSYDWNTLFKAYLEVGIDTVIIQRATKHVNNSELSDFYYKASNDISWKGPQYPIMERMFSEAEKTGMKLVVGLNGGKFPSDKGDANAYDVLYNKNRELLDDLYENFSNSPAMAGWYISEEFHDGMWMGWWKDSDRMLLAHYQQRVAAHAKSKPKKFLVSIAPALWRGRPADMTYDFFKSYFQRTPDIDILYLQDCAGRLNFNEADLDVVLPHWYHYIKKACDETGVQFGIDIEAFKNTHGEPYLSKPWGPYLQDQLKFASMFTKNITMFSWRDFRPGVGAYDEYRQYLNSKGLLRKIDR